MRHTDNSIRVGGTWFAVASFLMVMVLLLHGPISPDLSEQMTRVSGSVMRWFVAHWIAAAGLSLHAVAGLIILGSQSRLTRGWWTMTAWAVVPVAALWTLTTAVAEATVVSDAARSGNRELFEAWWAFAEGKANGFSFLALAVALIAGNEAQSGERVTPAWSAWTAMVAGVLSFTGWALGMWFGVGFGSGIWVISSILMSAWGVWFGVALSRSARDAVPTGGERRQTEEIRNEIARGAPAQPGVLDFALAPVQPADLTVPDFLVEPDPIGVHLGASFTGLSNGRVPGWVVWACAWRRGACSTAREPRCGATVSESALHLLTASSELSATISELRASLRTG